MPSLVFCLYKLSVFVSCPSFVPARSWHVWDYGARPLEPMRVLADSATGGRGLLAGKRNRCHGLPLWRDLPDRGDMRSVFDLKIDFR